MSLEVSWSATRTLQDRVWSMKFGGAPPRIWTNAYSATHTWSGAFPPFPNPTVSWMLAGFMSAQWNAMREFGAARFGIVLVTGFAVMPACWKLRNPFEVSDTLFRTWP